MDSGGSNKPTPKRVIKIDPTKLNSNVKDSLKLALAKLKGDNEKMRNNAR